MIAANIVVTRVAWRTTFTDLGRRDAEISGVPRGGAADQYSAKVANILVQNPRRATLFEAIGEFGFVSPVPLLVAVTGGTARVTVDGVPVPIWKPLVIQPGQEFIVGLAFSGLRTYIAVGGALDAPRFMGSSAPDPRMGFVQQLAVGQAIGISHPSALAAWRDMDAALLDFDVPRLQLPENDWMLEVVPAAEHNDIPGIRALMENSLYTVKPQSDHVGVRLDGPVEHANGPEIISHGVPIGAVEIPHADELILLARYRTLTAGYPIVGVVAQADLPLLGQLSAGRSVGFRWISRQRAVERAASAAARLTALESKVTAAFGSVIARIGATWWL